jgi:hypothetical protein
MLGWRSQFEPRSHFGVRLALLMLLLLPPPLVVLGAAEHVLGPYTAEALMEPLLVVAVGAVLLAGPVLFRDLGSSSGGPDGEGGGGPGPDDPPPTPPPGPPAGGIPLPDAVQASWRVRDHNGPDRRRRPRRPARERERRRVPG